MATVKPGYIKLVKLQKEGRLQKGDVVETSHLGMCEVSHIQSADTVCVKSAEGLYFTLSGLGFNARVVDSE